MQSGWISFLLIGVVASAQANHWTHARASLKLGELRPEETVLRLKSNKTTQIVGGIDKFLILYSSEDPSPKNKTRPRTYSFDGVVRPTERPDFSTNERLYTISKRYSSLYTTVTPQVQTETEVTLFNTRTYETRTLTGKIPIYEGSAVGLKARLLDLTESKESPTELTIFKLLRIGYYEGPVDFQFMQPTQASYGYPEPSAELASLTVGELACLAEVLIWEADDVNNPPAKCSLP